MLIARYYLKRLTPFILLFLGVQTLLRGALFLLQKSNLDIDIFNISAALTSGLIMDLAVFTYFAAPLTLYLFFLPAHKHGSRTDKNISALIFFIFTYIIFFTAVAEWLFWDEFATRFNFIAVDYMIYTREVVGNIRESYHVLPLLALIAILSMLLTAAYLKYWPSVQYVPKLASRCWAITGSILAMLCSFFLINTHITEVSSNRYLNEIAKNGTYEFFSAYWRNELPFEQFYLTGEQHKLLLKVRTHLSNNPKDFVGDNIIHKVHSSRPALNHNVVLIIVESLSADYMAAFGNSENLTPNLDKLAAQSLFFTNLRAIGTRTVYGLAATTLSIPPLPGNSIVRRPDNGNLFNLGSVFKQHGYTNKFIYGGFGYFDNMNSFFAANGYQTIDRADLQQDEITFGNIWGVADEDLFNRVLKENDHAYKQNKPFFDVVLTTSNHRPFTYPAGRIDILSPGGRKGGVKYTDYAIGKFIDDARTHPWFNNTIFVVIADHTAGSSGKLELDPDKYLIPLLIYAPKTIKPKYITTLSSQIDLAPTLLGLLNFSYDSHFYGQDMLKSGPKLQRAFISNYQQLGYLTPDKMAILKPIRQVSFFRRQLDTWVPTEYDAELLEEMLSYYQSANNWNQWNKE